MMRFHSK